MYETEIPVTAKEFDAWASEHSHRWPIELGLLAGRALLTLKMIDLNPPWKINAMAEHTPQTYAAMMKDLMNFAEAYGAWRAREHG